MIAEALYWGFTYNAKLNVISVVIRDQEIYKIVKKEKMFVLMVSLNDGSILWQHEFDFIHDVSFNQQGNLMAIFERPKTDDGYVHIVNIIRKEWICHIHLEYNGLPFGWDAFAWWDDSLIFMSPHNIAVLSHDEMEKIENIKKQEIENLILKDQQKKTKGKRK